MGQHFDDWCREYPRKNKPKAKIERVRAVKLKKKKRRRKPMVYRPADLLLAKQLVSYNDNGKATSEVKLYAGLLLTALVNARRSLVDELGPKLLHENHWVVEPIE